MTPLLWLYEFLLIPLALALLPFVSLFNAKVREGLRLRRLDRSSQKSLHNCIWIHVSSGEWEYAKPLARLLKSRGEKVLVTHFSPSVRKSLESSPEADVIYALPLDNRFLLKDFFRRFQPRILLLARTDLWPTLLRETKKRKLPIVLFSATLSKEVLASRSVLSRVFQKMKLSLVDKLYCVSTEDQVNLDRFLGCSVAIAIGDTRFDQAMFRIQNPKKVKNITDRRFRYVIAGSTWKPDEEVLAPAIALLKESPLRFVIVPHEPSSSHIRQLRELLAKHGLKTCLYSEVNDSDWSSRGEVCVVDQVGILAELYLKGDLAFVGNSFVSNSVHSVMEPLAAGCLTFVGPFHKNNREAIEFSRVQTAGGFRVVEVVNDSQGLALKLKEILRSENLRKSEIQGYVAAKAGASQRLSDEISSLVSNSEAKTHSLRKPSVLD